MPKILYVKTLLKNPSNPMAPKKTYAQSQARAEIDINGLAKHMTEHGSTYSRGTLYAVITDMCDHITELIRDGYIVRLGELGTFNVTLSSEGVCESVEDSLTGEKPVFTAKNITGVNVRFTPGKGLNINVEDVEFEQTQTQYRKAEALKAKNQAFTDGSYKADKPKHPDDETA